MLSVGTDEQYIGFSFGNMKTGNNSFSEEGSVIVNNDNYLNIKKAESGEGYLIFAIDPPSENNEHKPYFELSAYGGLFSAESGGLWSSGNDNIFFFTNSDEETY